MWHLRLFKRCVRVRGRVTYTSAVWCYPRHGNICSSACWNTLNNCFWSAVVFTRVQPFFPPVISLSLSLYYDVFATTAHETVGPTNPQLSEFFIVTSLLQTTLDGNNLQALGMLKLLARAFCMAYDSRNTDAGLLNKPAHAINLGV